MAKIKLDSKNYRVHTDKNKMIIDKSLKELGAGRSILIDSENEIIAGNGVFEQAEKQNIKIKIVETDGTELIAVKRTDLKTNDKKRKKLALIDNHASDTSEFDMELVKQDFEDVKLEEWEFDLEKINNINEINEKTYNENNLWFLNIEFNNEADCQKYYNKFINEGLICKIIQ